MVTDWENKQKKAAEDEEKREEERLMESFKRVHTAHENKQKEAEDEEKSEEERPFFVSGKELREEDTMRLIKRCLKIEASAETGEEQATEQPQDEEEKEASEDVKKRLKLIALGLDLSLPCLFFLVLILFGLGLGLKSLHSAHEATITSDNLRRLSHGIEESLSHGIEESLSHESEESVRLRSGSTTGSLGSFAREFDRRLLPDPPKPVHIDIPEREELAKQAEQVITSFQAIKLVITSFKARKGGPLLPDPPKPVHIDIPERMDLVKESRQGLSDLSIVGKIFRALHVHAEEGQCKLDWVVKREDGISCNELDLYFSDLGYSCRSRPNVLQDLAWLLITDYNWDCPLEINWC